MTMPEPTMSPEALIEDLRGQLVGKNAQIDQLVAQNEQLIHQGRVSLWLYKEIEYKVKLMAARQLMNRPDVQQRMQELLIQKMDSSGATGL